MPCKGSNNCQSHSCYSYKNWSMVTCLAANRAQSGNSIQSKSQQNLYLWLPCNFCPQSMHREHFPKRKTMPTWKHGDRPMCVIGWIMALPGPINHDPHLQLNGKLIVALIANFSPTNKRSTAHPCWASTCQFHSIGSTYLYCFLHSTRYMHYRHDCFWYCLFWWPMGTHSVFWP